MTAETLNTVKCSNCGAAISGEAGFGMVICEKCGSLVMLGSSQEGPKAASIPDEFLTFEVPLPSEAPMPSSFVEPVPAVPAMESIPEPDGPKEVPSEVFKDVVEFANTEQPSQGFGALVYDLKIQGVDTPEIREEVSACLSDKRLKLEAADIMKQIEKGVLLIKHLNPVKAAVIVTRMRHLPVKLSWTSQQLIKTVIFIILFFSIKGFTDDYARHQADLQSYALRIAAMQDDLRVLIAKKDRNSDPVARDKFLEEIKKNYDELKGTFEVFRREKEHVIYEHPEQGDSTERTYKHVKIKSLEELENESGMDNHLTRLKHKVEKVYSKSLPASTPRE